MDILNHEHGLDALSFAFMVSPEIAEEQHKETERDPYIDQNHYLEVAAVLYELDKRMEEYLLLPFLADTGPTLRGFLYFLLENGR